MFELLVDHVWQSTLFVIAAGLLTLAFRRHGAHVRYWIWFTASMKFLVPFALIAALGSQFAWRTVAAPVEDDWRSTFEQLVQPMIVTRATVDTADTATVSAPRPTDRVDSSGAESTAPLNSKAAPGTGVGKVSDTLAQLALWVWALGAIAVAATWLRRWLSLRALARDSKPVYLDMPEAADLQIRKTDMLIEPGVFGIVSPTLLLPGDIVERLKPRELACVLVHERIHIERRDNLTALLHMLVEAVFWFHPLVWWMGARLVAERERACDEAVLQSNMSAHHYAKALIAVCTRYLKAPLPCTAGVGGGPLHTRVLRIARNRSRRELRAAGKAVLATSLAATMIAPLIAGLLGTTHVVAQEPARLFPDESFLDESLLDDEFMGVRQDYVRAVEEFGVGSAQEQQAEEQYFDYWGERTRFLTRSRILDLESLDDPIGELSRAAQSFWRGYRSPHPFFEFDADILDTYTGYYELELNAKRDYERILSIQREGPFLVFSWNDLYFVLGATTATRFSNYRFDESRSWRGMAITGQLQESPIPNLLDLGLDEVRRRSEEARLAASYAEPSMTITFQPPIPDSDTEGGPLSGQLNLSEATTQFSGLFRRVDAQYAERKLDEISVRFAEQSAAAGSHSLLTDIAMRLSDDVQAAPDSTAAQSAQEIIELFETRMPGLLDQRGDFFAVEHRETFRSGEDLFEVIFENLAFTTIVGANAGDELRPLTFNLSCRPRLPRAEAELGNCASQQSRASSP